MADALRDALMSSTSARSMAGFREGRQQAGPGRALTAGVGVAILLLAGSLVVAALVRVSMRVAGASAIADPLDLPGTSGAASAAATWAYVLFQSSLLPHPIPGTQWWTWGGGSLLLLVVVGGLAFRSAAAARGRLELALVVAPSLLVGVTAGATELIADHLLLPLELAPLVAVPVALGALLARAWARLRQARSAIAGLRAAQSAAFAVAGGLAVAAIPILLLAPPGSQPPGTWLFLLLPYVPNAVLRATFGGGLHVYTLVGVALFALAAVAAGVHLRTRSLAERGGYLVACAALLAAATAIATPASNAGAVLAVVTAALPGALATGLAGALFGPLLGRTAAGHRLASIAALEFLGDRLPPPPASELTARDMVGARPATQDELRAYRPPARAQRAGRAAVALSLILVLASVTVVAAVTFTGTAPEASAPELTAARAYLAAQGGNDADRLWPAVTVDTSSLPAGAGPRLLGKSDLARMLAVPGNRHTAITGVKVAISGRTGATTLVRATYVEVGVPRQAVLPMTSVDGAWKVLITPAAIQVAGAEAGAVTVDGEPVTPSDGQPLAVLPGVHSVQASYPAPFTPGKVSVDAEQPYPASAIARVAPQLDPALLAGARAAAAAALGRCAASSTGRTAHCPQGLDAPAGEVVRWSIVGDPAASLAVAPAAGGGIVATGVFQMIGAYAVHIPEDTKHVASAGGFRVALGFAGGAWSPAGDIAPVAGAVARPAASDDALTAAVRAGFQRCAASRLLRPADCPQTVPSTYFVKNVAWRFGSDPLAGAQTGFDAQRGVLTVTGTFAMTVAYNEGGQDRTAPSSGRYRADLLWDGQQPVLVSITRG